MHRKKRIEKRYVVLILLFSITIILRVLFYTLDHNRKLIFFEKGIKDIGLFIEEVIYTPIKWINEQIIISKEKKQMYTDYHNTKKKLEEYELLEAKYNEVNKELNEVLELLELNSSMQEGTYINANTINRNIDYWFQNITIDKGNKHNIEKGNAVVNSNGLIGYVDVTSNYYSTVKLLTSENLNHKISVKIEVGESYVYGLLTYYNSKTNKFKIEGISENTGIPKDAVVTTTGLGNEFPSGLIIGYVSSVAMDNFDLAKTVYIKPAANFNDISYVTVITKEAKSWNMEIYYWYLVLL